MVRALKEIWRVLIPNGRLIDLRPLSVSPPIEIIEGSQASFAGRVDDSAGIADDIAANETMDRAVHAGWFVHEQKGSFEYKLYWDTPDEMQAYIEERWIDAILPKAVIAETHRLMSSSSAGAKVRTRLDMVISRYLKIPYQ